MIWPPSLIGSLITRSRHGVSTRICTSRLRSLQSRRCSRRTFISISVRPTATLSFARRATSTRSHRASTLQSLPSLAFTARRFQYRSRTARATLRRRLRRLSRRMHPRASHHSHPCRPIRWRSRRPSSPRRIMSRTLTSTAAARAARPSPSFRRST